MILQNDVMAELEKVQMRFQSSSTGYEPQGIDANGCDGGCRGFSCEYSASDEW